MATTSNKKGPAIFRRLVTLPEMILNGLSIHTHIHTPTHTHACIPWGMTSSLKKQGSFYLQSQSANTIQGFFPPSSKVTLFRLLLAAASLISWPTWKKMDLEIVNTYIGRNNMNPCVNSFYIIKIKKQHSITVESFISTNADHCNAKVFIPPVLLSSSLVFC